MRIPVAIPEGEYGFFCRKEDAWEVRYREEVIAWFPNEIRFDVLGRDEYRLLGKGEEAMVIRFSDLHRHSDNSLLDGMSKVKDIVKKTEYSGALTDHGAMYGFLEYYKSMRKAGKHPIIGTEAYMPNMAGELKSRHVILLAKNNIGVQNLYKLSSESFDHFYYKPHITWEMLEKYHEGLICLSACLGGVIPSAIRDGMLEEAEQATERFISIFGKEDFYIEIQRHFIREEDIVRSHLLDIAVKYGLKLVATTDSHYPDQEDAYSHEVLLCIQTGKMMSDANRMAYDGKGYFLMNSEEMEELFFDFPDALDNTLEIAEKCHVELKLNDVNLPDYELPEGFQTPMDYMLQLATDGYHERFHGTEHESDPVYQERFDYEINMIRQMGFASYFIIVWDFINYARTHNIYVGPGRGSAAGSLVAYCLGITDLDPIKYNLLFERFLNPERVSYPDIDTDIEYSKRPEVIQYMIHKYGAENVCRIVTFGTLAAKQAIKDVGKCLGQSVSYCAKLAGMVPASPGMTIELAMEQSQELQGAYENDESAKQIIDIARKLEGNKRHASQHACGLCVAPQAVSNFLPTSMEIDDETKEKALTTQVVKDEVEELSLIKMDLLGLKNMGVIHEVIDRVVEEMGETNVLKKIHSLRDVVRYQDIPLNDRATYEMLAKGLTGGVFQLESEGITNVVKQMFADIDSLPDERLDECFERLIATVALYRPGPMDFIPNYMEGMRDVENIHYLTPELESILRPTYGVIVYQEQVMQIVQKLAGYSLGRADIVRKAMGKKKQDVMDAEKQVFVYGNKEAFESGKDDKYAPGCVANGISEDIALEIWSQMADFAKYAFNRSHAACYAWIACITAYMSCHWTEIFYAALLNAFIDNSAKVKSYLHQASSRGISLQSPDINRSDCGFRAEGNNIIFGLQGISGVKGVAVPIVEERAAHGKFEDLQDFYERVSDTGAKLNHKSMEGLLYSNAFQEFSDNKNALLVQFNIIEKGYKFDSVSRLMGQLILFEEEEVRVPMPTVDKMDEKAEMEKECEMLGIYLTKHPTDRVLQNLIPLNHYEPLEEVASRTSPKRNITTVGMIREIKRFYTKSGKLMCMLKLETKFATMQAVVFPKEYDRFGELLNERAVIGITGSLEEDQRNESFQLITSMIYTEDEIVDIEAEPIVVKIKNKAEQDAILQYMQKNPGKTPISLEYGGRNFPLKNGVRMNASTRLFLSRFGT